MKIKVKKTRDSAIMPEYKTPGASGFDLSSSEDMTINMGSTRVVPTGLIFEIPKGHEMQVRPRSGLSLETGLRIPNAPGTIDSDYRGEVGVILHNTSGGDYTVKRGDRIAQGVVVPIVQAIFEQVEDLTETKRGEGGFGSTGVSAKIAKNITEVVINDEVVIDGSKILEK